jgi:hypothetical protein
MTPEFKLISIKNILKQNKKNAKKMFRKRSISVDVMPNTIYDIHLKFRRHFEFLKKVYFYSLVQNKKNAKNVLK